jgi:PAS domain S-box-containing protein
MLKEKIDSLKTLRESEERLRRAEIASKSGNWELHLDTGIMFGSEGAMKIYGINTEQFKYQLLKEIPLPQYRHLLDTALKDLVERNKPYDVEFKIKTLDTGVIKDIHSVAVYDQEKRILLGVIQDITERKKAEDLLKTNYSILRIAGETAKFGGWSVDLRENKVLWSDEVAAIHEMPPGYAPFLRDAIN